MTSKTKERVRVPIWAKRRARGFSLVAVDKRVKAFVQRYGRLVTLLGAFIVFGTFVVKEALRDRAKDLLTDIRAAEGAYERRAQYDSLMATMFVIEERKAGDKSYSPFGKRGAVLTAAQLRENVKGDLSPQAEIGAEINNAFSLSAALPPKKEIYLAIHDASEAHEKWEIAAGSFNAPEFIFPQLANKPATDQQQQKAVELVDATVSARNKASSMTTKVLQYAYLQEQTRVKQSELFETMSVVFYSLGWALSLLGKLYEPVGSKSKAELVGEPD